jgi:hypothetical protein
MGNFVPKEISNERREICAGCDSNHKGWCIECGCNIDWKTICPAEHCPEDKWKAYDADRDKQVS